MVHGDSYETRLTGNSFIRMSCKEVNINYTNTYIMLLIYIYSFRKSIIMQYTKIIYKNIYAVEIIISLFYNILCMRLSEEYY